MSTRSFLVFFAGASFGQPAHSQAQIPLTESLRRVCPRYEQRWGSFAQAVVLPQPATGDVDGDGDIDFVLEGRVLINDGNGVLRATDCAPTSVEVRGATGELADMDGDGDLDLVQVQLGPVPDDGVQLWLNSGTGCFTYVPDRFPASSYWFTARLDVGDVDSDGDADVFIPRFTDLYSASAMLFLNNGDATFVDASQQPTLLGLGDSYDVELIDFDADGDLDAFCYGDQSKGDCCYPNNALLLNDGAGVFSVSPIPLPYPARSNRPGLIDVDGDLDIDLWVPASSMYGLFRNDGLAGFTDISAGVPALTGYVHFAAIADFDRDGDADAVLDDLQATRTYLNDGSGVFTAAVGSWPGELWEAAAVDVDGDLDLDLFHGEDILFNTGAGQFTTAPVALPHMDGGVFLQAIADLDGDGDVDIAHSDLDYLNNGYAVRLLTNRGNGSFDLRTLPDLSGDYTHAVAFLDVDGDQDFDLVTNPVQPALRVFLNDGTGDFSQLLPTVVGVDATTDIHAGDIDGDGDLDLLCGGGPVTVWLNAGNGQFTQALGLWPAGNVGTELALGDLDGDGDVDAAALGAANGASLLLNNGSGMFQVHGSVFTPSTPTWPARTPLLGDPDGDGDLDLVASRGEYYDGGRVLLALNDGAGAFVDAGQWLPPIANEVKALAIADFDRDGDLDLLAERRGEMRLLANDGTGAFEDAGVIAETDDRLLGAVLCLDLDADQDMDVLGSETVLINITRQVAWRTPPRIGRTLELDLHGPADRFFKLYGSLGRAFRPFGEHGTLMVDTSQVVYEVLGRYDANGFALATRDIPNDLALVGLDVYWQTYTAARRRFSNLEITRIENY